MFGMPPIPPHINNNYPKKYVEEKCSRDDIITIQFDVNTIIRFPAYTKVNESKIVIPKCGMVNPVCVYMSEEYCTPESYMFQVPVILTGEEYDKYRAEFGNDFNKKIIKIAENGIDFQKMVDEILTKFPNRKYDMETFLVQDPDKVKYAHHEWTEFVAIY